MNDFGGFDFGKVALYMQDVRWRWFKIGIPGIEHIRALADYLVHHVADGNHLSSGGLRLEKSGKHYSMEFRAKNYTKKNPVVIEKSEWESS